MCIDTNYTFKCSKTESNVLNQRATSKKNNFASKKNFSMVLLPIEQKNNREDISSIINLKRSHKFTWTGDYSTKNSARVQRRFVKNCLNKIKIVKMTQGCLQKNTSMVYHCTFRSSSIFVVVQAAQCRHVDFIGFNSGMSNKKTRYNSVLHSSWSI